MASGNAPKVLPLSSWSTFRLLLALVGSVLEAESAVQQYSLRAPGLLVIYKARQAPANVFPGHQLDSGNVEMLVVTGGGDHGADRDDFFACGELDCG
ncbi:hypothetical protein IWZ00DRAFT_18093 [Phyllosticta capitalensis]